MRIKLPQLLDRIRRRLREFPSAYVVGPALFAAASALLIVSLTIETGVVATAFDIGTAPPGIAERNVSFRASPLFRASLVTGICGVEFHLLNDSAYDAYKSSAALPPPTLDCNRKEALVDGRVGHLVTNYTAPSGSPNASYSLSVTFFGPRAPYALLSVPGAGLALGATIWVSVTILARGTERLLAQARLETVKRNKK